MVGVRSVWSKVKLPWKLSCEKNDTTLAVNATGIESELPVP